MTRLDLAELEERARDRLDHVAYDYYAGGADDELTLRDNVAAWTRLRLRPHVLRDVSDVDTSATLLGTPAAWPALVAPMAFQRLAHGDGERATARAAARTGTPMVVSTFATVRMEDVAAAAPGAARWFQLYVHQDREFTLELVRRAAAAGYRALVLTLDLPVVGNRRRDERNTFALPPGLHMANVNTTLPETDGSGLHFYTDQKVSAALTPALLDEMCGLSDLPVLVKGVLRGDDAGLAIDAGAAGVIVSNHGGRQLDTAVATADALPEVLAAVGDSGEVYVDGGIRRGTDIVKALALGARGVLLGRPLLWGLATAGEQGVVDVLDGLRGEFARALALVGAPRLSDLTPDLVTHGHPGSRD